MKKLILTKFQDRYEKMIERWMKIDYESIISYCGNNNVAISDEMLPDNGGYDAFVDIAEKDADYQLGYVPKIKKGYKLFSRETFAFEDEKWSKRKYYKNRSGKHTFRGCDNPKSIKAFGIELSLRGWYRFTGKSIAKLKAIIDRGMSIEDCFNPRCHSVHENGKAINIQELCESEGVNYGSFRNRMSKFRKEKGLKKFEQVSESDYLDQLEKMKAIVKVKNESDPLEDGWKYWRSRYWLLVDSDSFADIIKVKNGSGETVPQIIHRLITIAKQNKAKCKTENTQQEKQ